METEKNPGSDSGKQSAPRSRHSWVKSLGMLFARALVAIKVRLNDYAQSLPEGSRRKRVMIFIRDRYGGIAKLYAHYRRIIVLLIEGHLAVSKNFVKGFLAPFSREKRAQKTEEAIKLKGLRRGFASMVKPLATLALEIGEISSEDIKELLLASNRPLLDELLEHIVWACRSWRRDIMVTVDDVKPIEEQTEGGFTDSNECPNVTGTRYDARLCPLHTGRRESTSSALSEMRKAGVRPANIFEAISIPPSHPIFSHRYEIVLLGTSRKVKGKPEYIGITKNFGRASLVWVPEPVMWPKHTRFLAVSRKGSMP